MLTSVLYTACSLACTTVSIPVEHNGASFPLVARTLEYAGNAKDISVAAFHPKGEKMGTIISTFSWVNEHAFFSLDLNLGDGLVVEGQNTAGLVVQMLEQKLAKYHPAGIRANGMEYLQMAGFLLGNCESIAEAKQKVATLNVTDLPDKADFGASHWNLIDKTGEVWVLEYNIGNGVPSWMQNSVGVLTNDPSFEWQVTNLNNYVALSSMLPKDLIQHGNIPESVSLGTQLLGMPGDSSPPSRFVKSFYGREFGMKGKSHVTLDQAVTLGTAIINTVQIVEGSVAIKNVSGVPYDFEATIWSVLQVPHLGRTYYRTMHDMTWKMVDVTKLNATTEPWKVRIVTNDLGIVDVTETIQPKQ